MRRTRHSGESADSLVMLQGWETVSSSDGGRFSSGPPPFGRRAVTAVAGDRWYYGYPERFEIEVYSANGRLERLIRRAGDNPRVTEEMAAFRRGQFMQATRLPEEYRQRQLEMPLPRTLPAFSAVQVDDEGYLWVGEYRVLIRPQRWAVFDPGGIFLGTLAVPANLWQVTQIGPDFVVGASRNEEGIEQVVVHRLIRGTAGTSTSVQP